MATWKKVIVSGSNISELNNDSNYLSTQGGGILSGSAEGDAQGQIKLNGVNINANDLGTGDSPTFASVTASLAGDVTGNVTGDVTGNADSATALASSQNFSITGDGTATAVSFDGTGAVALSLSLANDSVDSPEIADGAVDAVHLGATAKTAISGAFTTTSASIASDIATIVSTEFSLNIEGDSGNGIIDKTETLDIAGGDNITTSMSSNTLTVALSDDVVIAGNLTVQGTRTELNVANLNVEDQFILLNSGSTSGDSGIIFGGSGDGAANAGHAIFIDNEAGGGASDIFKFASNVAHDATTGGAGEGKLGFIQTSTSVPSSAPNLQGVGSIHIKTDSEDIYIYS
jgi:hypothetical protein